jgi:hypothetical protein
VASGGQYRQYHLGTLAGKFMSHRKFSSSTTLLIQGVIRHESYTDPKQKNGTMAVKWQCNDWVRTKF